MGMVQSGCGQSGDGTLKLTVSAEWIDGINWLKADENKLGWKWSKMGVTILLLYSKIDYISRMSRWNNQIFLHAGTNSGKLKVDLVIFGWAQSKMARVF